MVQTVNKKGILQCDIDLNFQTKRLSTNLSGYVSKSDATLITKMIMTYRFLNESTEKINFEFKTSDRSSNIIKSYQSDLRLITSAYPQYNVEASIKLQVCRERF